MRRGHKIVNIQAQILAMLCKKLSPVQDGLLGIIYLSFFHAELMTRMLDRYGHTMGVHHMLQSSW